MATHKVKAFACKKGGEPLEEMEFTTQPLRSDEVVVKIQSCGICMSDVDCLSGKYDAWNAYKYPLVAGHEGVGKVIEAGSDVKHLKVGDTVGMGVYRNSCGSCKFCFDGENNLCNDALMIFRDGNFGCFADHVVINAKFALPIPASYPSEFAGPLMCAGSTCFAPFVNHNIRPGDKVGVVGIGGLGHLAVQFAKAYGCDVYAFSSSANKEEEVRNFGANNFILTSDEASKASALNKLDYILVTASGSNVDYSYLAKCLKKKGTIIVMGATGADDIGMAPMELVLGQKQIAGSANGSLGVYKQMLEFCALHKIFPMIETFPVAQINEALARVKEGKAKYRAVLKF